MSKKRKLQSHHLYLGVGGVMAVTALVLSLTFGLSGAQMPPPGGDMGGNMPPPPSGGTYTPPPSGGSYTPPPSGGTYTPPPSGDSYTPPGGGTYIPPPSGGTMTCPPGETGTPPNCSGVMQNQQPPSGTNPPPSTCIQPSTPCPTGMGFDMGTCTCRTGTTTPPPTGGTACPDGRMPTASQPCTGTPGTGMPGTGMGGTCASPMPTTMCTAGQYYECMSGSWRCTTGSTTLPPPSTCIQPLIGCPTGRTWNQTNCTCEGGTTMPPPTGGTACPDGRMPTASQPCTGSQLPGQNQQQQGLYPAANTIQPFGTNMTQPMAPGECPSDMQKCPDLAMQQWNPNATMCMPKTMYYDMKTNQQIPAGKLATCADFQTPSPASSGMGMPGMNQGMGMTMPGQQGTATTPPAMGPDYCKQNPWDMFCKSGEGMVDYNQQYNFDNVNVEDQQKQYSAREIQRQSQELFNFAGELSRDCEQIKWQVEEIRRDVAGLNIPTISEVEAIGTQFCALAEEIESSGRNMDSTAFATLQAKRKAADELRQTVFGKNGKPGKLASLNVARDMGWIVQRNADELRRISMDCSDAKDVGVSADVLAKCDAVVAKLQAKVANPLAGIQAKGMTFADLAEKTMNFRPAKSCEKYGIFAPPMNMGPGTSGPGGPMGGSNGGSMGGGGQGGFGGGQVGAPMMPPANMGGFGDEMMKKMQQKMQEMQSGASNFNYMGPSSATGGGAGSTSTTGSPFGTSVLTAQNFGGGMGGGQDGFSMGGGKNMGGGFGGPMMGPPPIECMRPLDIEVGPEAEIQEFEKNVRPALDNAFKLGDKCVMFEMGSKKLATEKNAPKGAAELVSAGLAACKKGDVVSVEAIAQKMFRMMQQGPQTGMGQFELIDSEEMLVNKLEERLRKKLGLDSTVDTSTLDQDSQDRIALLEEQLAESQKKLEEVTAKLNEATQALIAVNAQLADLTTKLTHADATDVLNNLAMVTNTEWQDTVVENVEPLAEKLEQIRAVVSKDVQPLVDQTLENFIKNPPGSETANDIEKELTLAINSCLNSTAKECATKVEDDLIPTVLALNSSESAVIEKIQDGIIPSLDVADTSAWYFPWATNAVDNKYAAVGATGNLTPTGAETKEAVAVRACRLGDIPFTEVKSADAAIKTQDQGVSYWASGCVKALEDRGVNFMGLGKLNEPAKRAETAHILATVLKDKFDVDTSGVSLQSDAVQNKYAEDMKWVKAAGVMGSGDAFNPEGTSNRAEGFVIANKLGQLKEDAAAPVVTE